MSRPYLMSRAQKDLVGGSAKDVALIVGYFTVWGAGVLLAFGGAITAWPFLLALLLGSPHGLTYLRRACRELQRIRDGWRALDASPPRADLREAEIL
jgi:hypothetical protein